MKIARLFAVPGSERSLENYSVPGIQKHLGRATRIFRGASGFVFLENEADITHAVADVRHFPRTATHLVKDGSAEIPGNLGLPGSRAGVVVSVARLADVRQRALFDNLRKHHCIEEPGLELIVKLLFVDIWFRLAFHLWKKGAGFVKALGMLRLLEGSQGLLPHFGFDNRIGPAILPHPVWHHDEPQLRFRRLLANRLKNAIGKHAYGSIHALVRLVEVEMFVDFGIGYGEREQGLSIPARPEHGLKARKRRTAEQRRCVKDGTLHPFHPALEAF